MENVSPLDRNQARAAGYDRPGETPSQSRSAVLAKNGIVATSQPLAAQVGLEVLKAGGNAIDAAIATNAMLGLVEPMNCGIGGDLFAIYWHADSKRLYGLNASGRSPYLLNIQEFRNRDLDEIPLIGPLSWSVPGCVDGWDMLARRFGTMELAQLLQPAIAYGEEGFPVSTIIAQEWADSEAALGKWPDSAKTFLPDGRPPQVGELFRNPYLAATYRTIAEQGRDAFYNGAIAQEIVAFSEQNGGYFSLRDFADHKSEWIDPVSTTYRGYRVWELPPNGQGIAVLELLNVLEGFDVRAMGFGSPDYLHVFTEAKKLAFADRAKFYADPAFNSAPVAQLISKDYGNSQRRRIEMNRAAPDVVAGDPLRHGDTVYLTVVDRDRNCCSLIQSNFLGFGSKATPGDLGFALQNRGALFALDEDHPNALEPHKRPFHTIIPGFVTREGRPWLCFGLMGGDMQPQGHVQILCNMIDFDMNVQQAGDAARVRHNGSATPTGQPAEADGGSVAFESGIPKETVKALEQRGHNMIASDEYFGGYQAILIDPEHNTLHGGTDPRKDGAAVGY